MSQISPPIRILLVCAVAFMAAWMLFLRPSTDAGTPAGEAPVPTAATPPAEAGGEKSGSLAGQAVEAANETTAATDARVERIQNGTETAGDAGQAANATPETAPATAGTATAAGKPGKLTRADATGLPPRVLKAIADRKVIALLFWSPRSIDDQQVRKALRGIDRHDGKVMAHATHIKRIASYQQITRGAEVEQSPTIVVIDRNRTVQTLVGFVDRTTIDQAVTDALRASKK
jgi:hypothetical protein